jgi:hypothetical protein
VAYGHLQGRGGGAILEGGRSGEVRSCTGCIAGVLEDAKVQRFLVWLYAPGDGVAGRDIDPADKVRLAARSALSNKLARRTYLAVHFDVLHARHLVRGAVCAVRLGFCDSWDSALFK